MVEIRMVFSLSQHAGHEGMAKIVFKKLIGKTEAKFGITAACLVK